MNRTKPSTRNPRCADRSRPRPPHNGEVEGPPRSARQVPRAHTVLPRPRRVTTHRSRTPPTIVRGRQPHRHLPTGTGRRELPLQLAGKSSTCTPKTIVSPLLRGVWLLSPPSK